MEDFKSFLEKELSKTKPVFNSELQIEIGNKIKEYRLKNNMTQKELADLSGIKQNKISQIENGSLNITIRTLERLFDILGFKVHIMEEKK